MDKEFYHFSKLQIGYIHVYFLSCLLTKGVMNFINDIDFLYTGINSIFLLVGIAISFFTILWYYKTIIASLLLYIYNAKNSGTSGYEFHNFHIFLSRGNKLLYLGVMHLAISHVGIKKMALKIALIFISFLT